jgi:hypothetical protein
MRFDSTDLRLWFEGVSLVIVAEFEKVIRVLESQALRFRQLGQLLVG